jgi:predicted dehydrogenase
VNVDSIRWGILGPGGIANSFAAGLKLAPGARIAAIASRSPERADAFADRFGVPQRYVGYEALVRDPDIDIVYVSTPHPFHHSCVRLCIEHGKPVVCEKPFAVNASLARPVIALARERGVFLMEGMWTRYFPLMSRMRALVAGGAIGEVQLVQADFGFRCGWNPESRLLAPNLAGGALLDVGVYVISFASMLLGTPDRITGVAHVGETGVDEVAAITLGYPGGGVALLSCAVRANTPQEAMVVGTEGRIRIDAPFWQPSVMTVTRDGKDERIELPFGENGFRHEAEAAMAYLRAGKTESDILGLDETLSIAETMDTLRAQWGVLYPFE